MAAVDSEKKIQFRGSLRLKVGGNGTDEYPITANIYFLRGAFERCERWKRSKLHLVENI